MNSPKWRFGLLGRQIGYSKSPDIFMSICRSADISASFELLDLAAEQLEMKFSTMRRSFHGLSVTIPHKQLVTALVDDLTDDARAIDAVNSIHLRHGKTIGGNTDIDGFLWPLEDYRSQLADSRVLVIGNGGSARAVVYSLLKKFRVGEVLVVGRDAQKLSSFASHFAGSLPSKRLKTTVAPTPDDRFGLVVNCTPLGGFHLPDDSPIPATLQLDENTIYYDLNYNRPNSIVDGMRRTGHTAIDGAMMLVGQAVASFQWWTSIEVDGYAVAADIFPDA